MKSYQKYCSKVIFWTAVFFIVNTSHIFGQDYLHTFDIAELKEDLTILQSQLKRNHPGLYSYTDEHILDSIFLSIEQSLLEPMTSIEYHQQLIVLNKYIKDAHTKILVPQSYNLARNTELPRFPFACHIERDKLYILRNLSLDNSIKEGTEILDINGIPIENIIKNLVNYISRDGNSQSRPLQKISDDFSGYYSLNYGTPVEFKLLLRDGEGNIVEKTIKALKTPEIVLQAEKRNYKSHQSQSQITFRIKDTIAILTLKSFEGNILKEAGIKYKKEFERIFKKIHKKGISHLIIDIRNNHGGWPEVADELLSYVANIPFFHSRSIHSVVDRLDSDLYLEDGSVPHFNKQKLQQKGQIFIMKGAKKAVKPKKNAFLGYLFVLIDGNTSSQAAEFASLLADNTNAIFVGTETGGSATQNCGGDIVTLVLPNTRLRVEIPMFYNVLEVKSDSQQDGVIPNHSCHPSIQSLLDNRDLTKELALKLITFEKL